MFPLVIFLITLGENQQFEKKPVGQMKKHSSVEMNVTTQYKNYYAI